MLGVPFALRRWHTLRPRPGPTTRRAAAKMSRSRAGCT